MANRRADRSQLGLTEKNAVTNEVLLTPNEKLAEEYRRAFISGPGLTVYDDLQKRFGNRRSYVPDSNATAFHEGQRDVFLMIQNYVERKPQPSNPNEESND